ncbi:type II toxin-antitoxin system PemK/MazF family toxin [Nocardioides sp. SYSU D00038]|uniref:type II toxin-antitoxin system PemK/MazF family toxin n=1 Tax=Nocardioides sp. SYSU D00038 TaxID=2812554 RepID=UPI001966D695|nr:type II toxin-antitoxin system PemK/MazF family toxin [Nocardioides sp. SYSU D00038]
MSRPGAPRSTRPWERVARAVRRSVGRSPQRRVPRSLRDQIGYAPEVDGEPDPGEVVWAWVTYDEDASRGKDRPVLVVGRRDGGPRPQWLGLMLSSQDHDLDAADEARHGRHWMDVGSGDWDHERRPSEVRLDRLLVLDDDAVRREGAVLDRVVFDAVLAAAREFHPLP